MTRTLSGGFATLALILTSTLATAACASATPTGSGPAAPATSTTATTSTTPTTAATGAAGPVTLTRSGGFVGAVDRIVIQPAGTWVRTDKTGPDVRGQLTDDQVTQLRGLVGDPALRTPVPSQPVNCADGYSYTLSAGSVNLSYSDCGHAPAKASQIATLILGWTKT
jgi:hypothetical protein